MANGDTECPSEAKVSEFEHAGAVNEKILWLKITMQDAAGVTIGNAVDQLVQVGFNQSGAQSTDRIHKTLEVLVEVLKDEIEFLIGVHDVFEQNDVWVGELF